MVLVSLFTSVYRGPIIHRGPEYHSGLSDWVWKGENVVSRCMALLYIFGTETCFRSLREQFMGCFHSACDIGGKAV
jgi:hypothetical protein